jgi:response regulator RpfG family c-di-GMP phosphodiesterase
MTVESKEHVVLLIDDDRNVLHALSRALRPQAYRLYTATSAREAMMVLKAHKVDVVVSDEQMPGMRGSELLTWAAEHCPDIARIVLTGHATTDNVLRAINEGHVYQFFTKPCDPLHLNTAISKALERKDLLDENRRLADANRGHEQELQRLRATVETLVRTVAQEVEKPLQTVSRTCRLLEDRNGEILDEEAKELVDRALEGVSEVERLVNELNGQCREDLASAALCQPPPNLTTPSRESSATATLALSP